MLVEDAVRDVAQLVRQCNHLTIERAYVRAARDFCGQSRWYVVNLTAPLAPDVRWYQLGADPNLEALAIDSVSLVMPNGQERPLRTMQPGFINPNVMPGQPVRYAYIPEGQIGFDPIPNLAYQVTIGVVAQPRDDATVLPDDLLVKWKLAFEYGALGYLYQMDGEPWANVVKSRENLLRFQQKINDAKADVIRQYQQGPIRATPRPFVVRS